ncbi:hypothetical protein NBRC10512_001827 [Rhodotorula toruloides]|uniref:RHTO0S19e00628g1_1 n=2 Tax=Rhodotorula toruloides TaxID=5286 RepID=A0A061BF62_RHOTO|nr:mitochondrial small subunit ribosomal protein S19 [Rhodotorula toruloides NP11]EMS20202.1 mitochondrial small subunit ribosomal protein S19 [Rhodotorula toruloides NP11]CDR48608.1 RHTO0S19e00628g1_1 [Rhodotorula toruloides]
MWRSPVLLSRSKWKVPYFVPFPGLAEAIKTNSPIRTTARNCTIMPFHVGATFLVHNGKDYIPLHVTPAHVGHKLGEFAHSKKPARHTPSKGR